MTDQPKKRGRPKGSRNRTPEEREAAKASKTVEHDRVHVEDLTDEQEYALICQHKRAYDRALDAKKAADAELKNVAKKAKAELGANVIDQIKLMHALESDEGKRALKERIEWQAKIARWQGMPVGHIDDLFAEDRTPIEDKTRADGKRAGLAGEDNAAPHHLDGLLKSKWQEGWNEGQAVVAAGFRPIAQAFGDPPSEKADEDAKTYLASLKDLPVDSDWRAVGAQGFQLGINGIIPDGVPDPHRDDWLEGWDRASVARSKRLDAEKRAAA